MKSFKIVAKQPKETITRDTQLKEVFSSLRGPFCLKDYDGNIVFEGALCQVDTNLADDPQSLVFSRGSFNRQTDRRLDKNHTVKDLIAACCIGVNRCYILEVG